MKPSEVKNIIIGSLERETDTEETFKRLEEAGISYDFSEGFTDMVLDRIYSSGIAAVRELEFVRSLNLIFKRIALTGIAAIVLLLISIYIMEGSISLDSFLGVSNNHDESIVCLLTGN
jgi:hypothetical protein